MPDKTIELIKQQAERCNLSALSDVLITRFRMGQSEYGETNHLHPWTDHALEAVEELMDRWIYLVLQNRRGAEIEDARIRAAAQQLQIEKEHLPQCDAPLRFFISGPYNAIGDNSVGEHIERARSMKASLMRRGHYTFCPHTESAYFEIDYPDIPRQAHLDNCVAGLDDCETMMMLPDWKWSDGAQMEHGIMRSKGLPIYTDILTVPVYWDGVLTMWASGEDDA